MKKIFSHKSSVFHGSAQVPGDKSISHRAVIFGALSIGCTKIQGLLEGQDVLATCEAFRKMGVQVTKQDHQHWSVIGAGLGGLRQPDDVLDMGNAGTAARLIMGVVGGHAISAVFTGDASLRSRPMGRVMEPLGLMGVRFQSCGEFLPLTVIGTDEIMPICHGQKVASAQVKSAILLAALTSRGTTVVKEKQKTRDHTENMLRHFGADICVEEQQDHTHISLRGQPVLKGADIIVPGDPSSAAFLVACACIVKDSHITLPNICINPTRIGFFITLKEMGADIRYENTRTEGGEPVADIVVKSAPLCGVTVPPARAASMIDEYPILSVVASFAKGVTKMCGVGELRVKESNRLQAIVNGLAANGVKTEYGEDWIRVFGKETVRGGGLVKTHFDHRVAMSFLCMGMASEQPVAIDDGCSIATSFPTFIPMMAKLGAHIVEDVS